jgi:hypothetical protein
MKKPFVILVVTIVVLAIAYFAYDLIKPKTVSPCETIFEQTATTFKTNLEIIKSKGEISVGKEKIQDLTEASQEVALNLKTCCIMSNTGKLSSEEFLKCQEMGNQFRSQINNLAQNVTAVQQAEASGDTKLAQQKKDSINLLVDDLSRRAKEISAHSADNAMNDQSSTKNQSQSSASTAKESGANLFAPGSGSEVLIAPEAKWNSTIDGAETTDLVYSSSIQPAEAVYGFSNGKKASFNLFTMLIPSTNEYNVKEFELFYGNDSPTGNFQSLGKFQTQNIRLFKTPYQQFSFAKVTAKYFKVRFLSNYQSPSGSAYYIYEFQLFGALQ